MNYRHAFHAGNFADLVKHAVLTRLLRDLSAAAAPLTVIDTHAGAGLYDLRGDEARRTAEAGAGIARLMAAADAPEAFADLKAAVARVNGPGEGVRHYPGSPLIIAGALRPRDRYIACELRPDDHAALVGVLARRSGTTALREDGWTYAARAPPRGPLLVLIDPPFEQGDDYRRTVGATRQILGVNTGATIAVWLPIKDLATFDAFLGHMEDAVGPHGLLTAEARLRPLANPLRLNGCAMIVVNPTPGLAAYALEAVEWVAATLGDAGALGRVTVRDGAV